LRIGDFIEVKIAKPAEMVCWGGVVMMQIALTGRVLRPIPRYSSLTGKQLLKER
jgi:hypothetical protein